MKNYCTIVIAFLVSSQSYGSSLLNNYKQQIQEKIDKNIPIKISTFTDFVDGFELRLEDESQKFMGLKPYIKPIVTFVKNISLQESTIVENSVPDYGESFTIQAVIEINDQRIPLRFTVASHVHDIEYYSFAVHIPDEVKIADFGTFEMKVLDNFFKNRWLVFTLFDHKDPEFGPVRKGLNIVADSDAQTVAENIGPQLEWLKKLVGYSIPTVRFSGSIPLAILGLVPFFVGSSLPQGITFETLRSLVRLKAVASVNKTLYSNDENSGITKVELESYDIIAHWGTGSGLQKMGFDVSRLFSFGFGVTTRIKTAMGPDIVAYGGVDIKPLGMTLHGKVEGEIKNPFGLPWISLHNVGFDFPLDLAGLVITGIGVRAQAGIGKSRFEVAGKAELGILAKSGLILHGKVEKIPFAAFTHFIQDDSSRFGWLKPLELDHAQVTIACGDTVVAEREFKSGITVRAQVGNSLLDKKAGFELYAYNTGTYYQFFGNGYLPKVQTDNIVFEGVDLGLNSKSKFYHEGPRLEFNYAFDFAFQKFMQAIVRANGRVKIGSLFDGMADIDISTITLARNVIMDWKNFFIALLREQKFIVKGKLFNTLGAELQIVESRKKDVYVKISFSQELVSRWEKTLRETIVNMKNSVNKKIELLDEKIEKLTKGMKSNAVKALERSDLLAQENEELKKENRNISGRIEKMSRWEFFKTIPLRAKQGYNATMIASNADLLNTIVMHGSFTESTALAFTQLRKAKKNALGLVNGIAHLTKLGVGLLGIEKVEAQGWLQEIMYQGKPLYLTVELRVMGEKKVISDIPFNGLQPLDSTKDLIMTVIAGIIGTDVPQEIIN